MNVFANPAFPDASTTLTLSGPAGAIEAAVELPAEAPRAGVAIVCHPHPLQGGTMHNKVATMTVRTLAEVGIAAVRFNFRGVGASEGEHDDGKGETDDVLAIAQWLSKERPGDVLWLAGFSFGSYVALRAAKRAQAAQLILIAPPVGRWAFEEIELPECPWLVVQGESDEVVDPAAVYAWVAGLPKPPTLVRMPDTSHFFHRRLMDLRGVLKNGVRDNLPPLQGPA